MDYSTEFTLYYTILDKNEKTIVSENCDKYYVEFGISLGLSLRSRIANMLYGPFRTIFRDYYIKNVYDDCCVIIVSGDSDPKLIIDSEILGKDFFLTNLWTVKWRIRITKYEKNEIELKHPGYD